MLFPQQATDTFFLVYLRPNLLGIQMRQPFPENRIFTLTSSRASSRGLFRRMRPKFNVLGHPVLICVTWARSVTTTLDGIIKLSKTIRKKTRSLFWSSDYLTWKVFVRLFYFFYFFTRSHLHRLGVGVNYHWPRSTNVAAIKVGFEPHCLEPLAN